MCDKTINAALTEFSNTSIEQEFKHLSKASKILRKYIFSVTNNLNGTFPPNCQQESTHQVVQAFFRMLVDGPGIVKQMNPEAPEMVASAGSAASLSLSQRVTYNAVKR